MIALSGCGSAGDGRAQGILRETFSGPHAVTSGVLGFGLTIVPSGSATITTPVRIALGGPFQSRGNGQLPASDLVFTIDLLGHHGQLGVISTAQGGYLTVDGGAYQLPPSEFSRLTSSFAGAAGGGGTGGLAKLGINPLHWLANPQVVGTATVGGAPTTHIRAGVRVAALLSDLNGFLARSSAGAATGGAVPQAISPATRRKLAAGVHHATVDIWTGTADRALRRITVDLRVPVTGRISSLLGGLSAAEFQLTIQYTDLNQPQTITAPTHVKPFSGFEHKLSGVISALKTTLGSGVVGAATGASGASSSSSTTGASATSTGSATTSTGYARCLQRAQGSVARMQRCASLLNSSGG